MAKSTGSDPAARRRDRRRPRRAAQPSALPIAEFLTRLGSKIPVLHGGSVRTALTAHLGTDPDPGIAADCADSSVGQALRILEERGRLTFETLPDAQGIRLSRFDAADKRTPS